MWPASSSSTGGRVTRPSQPSHRPCRLVFHTVSAPSGRLPGFAEKERPATSADCAEIGSLPFAGATSYDRSSATAAIGAGRGAAIRPEFPSQHFENTHFPPGMLRQLPKRFRRKPARHAQAAQRPAPKGAGLGREGFSTWPRGTRQPIGNARFMHRSCFPWSPFCFPWSPFSFPWSPSSFPWSPSSFPVGSDFLLPSSSCAGANHPAPARAFHPPGNPNARP